MTKYMPAIFISSIWRHDDEVVVVVRERERLMPVTRVFQPGACICTRAATSNYFHVISRSLLLGYTIPKK